MQPTQPTLLCLLVLFSCVLAQNLELVLFNTTEVNQWGTRCLNGSPSGYYYGPATSTANKNKWFFYLQGGGYCLVNPNSQWKNVENCKSRAAGALGNSGVWGKTKGRTSTFYPTSTWNQVWIPYCGGDLHTGTHTTSTSGLYTAGHLTIAAIFKKLSLETNLQNGDELIFTGDSAGGIGAFMHANFVKNQLPNVKKVSIVPNAGWFLDTTPYNPTFIDNSFEMIYKTTQAYLDPLCTAKYPSTPWSCFAPNNTYPFITVPTFVINSIFDSNALVSQAGIPNPSPNWPNPTVNQFVVETGAVMNATLQSVYNNPTSGIFSTSQFEHVLPASSVVHGQSLTGTFDAWYNGVGVSKVMDYCKTPNCLNITLPN